MISLYPVKPEISSSDKTKFISAEISSRHAGPEPPSNRIATTLDVAVSFAQAHFVQTLVESNN